MKKLFFIFLIFCSNSVFAQNMAHYLVYFKDKEQALFNNTHPTKYLSNKSIVRREKQNILVSIHDFPVTASYVTALAKFGPVKSTSKWLNAALVITAPTNLASIKALPFVKKVEGDSDLKGISSVLNEVKFQTKENKFTEYQSNTDFGFAKNQNEMIGVDVMHNKGYKGEGVLIGVIDSGFLNAPSLTVFQSLFSEKRVVETWDFVDNEANVYNDHSHGTNVLSVMAADQEGVMVGAAPKANYALYRSEDVSSETRIEEYYWLIAAEKADSLGVDVINSSLGYNRFDNPVQNYVRENMTGDFTIAAKAADWAVSKGIMVVVSAGNDGTNSWGIIGTPADADSVISVGAVDASQFYVSFSSIGPNAKYAVKPELAAKGSAVTLASISNRIATGNGTSFASPLIAGLAAGVIQAYPDINYYKLRSYLIESGNQFNIPDKYLGYGIPHFQRVTEIAEFEQLIAESGKLLFIYPNPSSENLNVIVTDENFGEEFSVYIHDISGKLLYQLQSNHKRFTLNSELKSLPLGVYYLILNDGKTKLSQRFSRY